ncbi:hypothetical protein Tco_1040692, partial [Tanacetum coccineum]
SLDGYLDGLQFGVGVPGGGEAILHAVNCLVEDRRDDVGLSMLLADFQNAFNLAWYLDDGTIIGDTLVVGKVLELITKDGPRCGLHLNVDKTEIFWHKEDPRSRLEGVFPPNISRPLHGVKLLGGPSVRLQTKLLRHVGIVAYGSTFDDALSVFNTSMEIDYLSNPSKIVAPKLMKKMAYKYFKLRIILSYWLRVFPISVLGTNYERKTYGVPCYRLGVPFISISKPCSACSKVFTGDIYGDHVVSCAGIIGIKHRHNAVRDTLVDICFRSGISAGKEVDIGLSGDGDKALRPADMLLYSWDGGLDVCVDLTGSSPLTRTGMADFAPGRALIDVAQRKRETDVVTLLKWIRKFSMAQDIRARVAIHIFNRISFAIAK